MATWAAFFIWPAVADRRPRAANLEPRTANREPRAVARPAGRRLVALAASPQRQPRSASAAISRVASHVWRATAASAVAIVSASASGKVQ